MSKPKHMLSFAVEQRLDDDQAVIEGITITVFDRAYDPKEEAAGSSPAILQKTLRFLERWQTKQIPCRRDQITTELGHDNTMVIEQLIRILDGIEKPGRLSEIIWDTQFGYCFELTFDK